jgi:hypothetical protein
MVKMQKIKLVDLLVNSENYRFETSASQKESIDKMINDQDEKVFNLAEHILKNELNPNDNVQVILSSHDKTKYLVLEGNRRVVALKLVSNPDLIDQNSSLKRKFRKLHEENKGKILEEITCSVYDDPKDADIWIGIKHGYGVSGVGTDGWDPIQKQRFGEKTEGKTSIALQTIKLLQTSADVPDDIKNCLTDLKTTNLDRLLSDPDVRDFLGIEINNGLIQSGIEQREVVKGLTQIAKDLLDPQFNVKRIYTKDDRKDYITKFAQSFKPDIRKKAQKPWQFTSVSVVLPSKSKTKLKPHPKDRKTLIPSSCGINIGNPKVNAIYHELRKLNVLRFTNAVAVLYRVFVELSVDCYIEKHKLAPTLSSTLSGTNFQQKVSQVANHLESEKLADAAICKGIRFSVKNKNDLLGLDTWHAYVHNNRFSPIANNLIITWDSIQDFMIILWNNIK